jgi:hypothetical protein
MDYEKKYLKYKKKYLNLRGGAEISLENFKADNVKDFKLFALVNLLQNSAKIYRDHKTHLSFLKQRFVGIFIIKTNTLLGESSSNSNNSNIGQFKDFSIIDDSSKITITISFDNYIFEYNNIQDGNKVSLDYYQKDAIPLNHSNSPTLNHSDTLD